MNDIFYKEYDEILKQLNIKPLKNKSILITGASGLIGSYIVYFLGYINTKYSTNIRIYALSRHHEELVKKFNNVYGIEIIEHDLNNVFNIDINFDYIIHAASNAHPLAYSKDPVGTMKTNLLGTINLLEAATKMKAKFLFVSTGEIYGNNIDHAFTENDLGIIDTKIARSCYPESKRAAETLCIAYNAQYGTNVNIARLCYVYGSTITENNTRADAQFLRNAVNAQNIIMKSSGKQQRTYCYVADVVCALLTILLYGKDAEFYNVSSQNSIASVHEYAQTLANIANVKVIYDNPDEVEAKGYSKQADSILDSTKLQQLGWKPNYSLLEGLEHTYKIKKSVLEKIN